MNIGKKFPFTQSDQYGAWQKSVGRPVFRYLIKNSDQNGKGHASTQIITYPLAFGRTYLYIPYGPIIFGQLNSELNDQIKKTIKDEMQKRNAVFARLDFTLSDQDTLTPTKIRELGYKLAPKPSTHSAYFQPRTEWILDLNPNEGELLSNMHEKTRYSIRLGYRKGIENTIVPGDDAIQYFEDFYRLTVDTAKRNGFNPHPKAYFQNIFESLKTTPNKSFLSIAKYSGQILVINLIIIHEDIAFYLYGGSSTVERNRMPSYVAMWEAIKHAKSLGAKYYNFGAVSDAVRNTNSTENNSEDISKASEKTSTKNSWSGITDFKIKFGGEALIHNPLVDLVGDKWLDKVIYHIYNTRKLIRTWFGK